MNELARSFLEGSERMTEAMQRWRITAFLMLLLAYASSAPAQSSAVPAQSPAVPAPTQSTLQLDSGWKFQSGDDPRWADPAFDDSHWATVTLRRSLAEQGIEPYTGWGWYRLHLAPQQFATIVPARPELLLTGNYVAQFSVYVNAAEVGRTRGMDDSPTMYFSGPVVAPFPTDGKPAVVAVRTWMGQPLQVKDPLLNRVELGPADDISFHNWLDQGVRWNQHVTAALLLSFLFLCVAGLAATLYFSQPNHSEYGWLALLCVSVALNGTADVLFGLARISFPAHQMCGAIMGRIFMAVTLEFIARFTNLQNRKPVRFVEAAIVLIAIFAFLPLDTVYAVLSVAAEVLFCVMVCVLLFAAWRRGQRDAGVMLLPFFFAATADSAETLLGYAAHAHWIPERFAFQRYHVGPIEFGTGTAAYAVFLGSLLAVIFYRFIRVSQDEQRSNAEIAAARSVQALLIPTQLPSSRNFMLESAYYPVNGVGGDFFQVLPLKDDSLLIVVGDVSGKGLQAAMNSSTLVGALRNELSHDPATVLEHLNRVLLGAGYGEARLAGSDSGPSFATCLCARAHPDGTLVIANAGHLGPYRDGRELEIPPGLPLGVIPNVQYEQVAYTLEQGDRLVFLSDGVVEATSPDGELFGFERTQQVSNEPARYIAQTAKRFGQTDDITVVSLYMASCEVRETDAVLNPI